MTVVTGLPSERLKADGEAYLAQARALFEAGNETESRAIGSHPEHLLRVYALSLFVESDVFQQLTGIGSGTRALANIDAELERLLVGAEGQISRRKKIARCRRKFRSSRCARLRCWRPRTATWRRAKPVRWRKLFHPC